jgi:hypothetical protein
MFFMQQSKTYNRASYKGYMSNLFDTQIKTTLYSHLKSEHSGDPPIRGHNAL